jgi:hypothetical protein
MKPVLHVTEFLTATTPIFSNTNPARCSKFCKGSGQSRSKGTGVYCLVMVFALTFPVSFHLVFTLSYLTRFCSSVDLKSVFGYFIHSKVLSLSIFKAFLRLFCFDLLELSEESRSG